MIHTSRNEPMFIYIWNNLCHVPSYLETFHPKLCSPFYFPYLYYAPQYHNGVHFTTTITSNTEYPRSMNVTVIYDTTPCREQQRRSCRLNDQQVRWRNYRPIKQKFTKCRSVARVKNVPFITVTSCKIFKVVKVQAVVFRTLTSYNKRCSALKKQVICFLETLVNTYQTTSCRSLEDNNMTISLLSFAICHCPIAGAGSSLFLHSW